MSDLRAFGVALSGRLLGKPARREVLLFGVGATDPLVYAFVGVFAAGLRVLASYVPAKRVVGIDPASIMKEE